MNYKYTIRLRNLNDLRQFTTDILYKINSDVDAIYDRQYVDAKSLSGLMSMINHNIKVVIHSNDEKELQVFKMICKRYEVK